MTKLKAKQMAECDAELAAVLFSRQEKIAKDDQPVREADAIRKRSVCLISCLFKFLSESLSINLKWLKRTREFYNVCCGSILSLVQI